MIDRESDLDQVFKRNIDKVGHCYKVENHVCNGMPDFYFSNENKVLWIEDKIVNEATDTIKFRPGQCQFLSNNYNGIAETYILVYNKSNNLFYIFDGRDGYQLQDNPMYDIQYLKITGKISEVVKWLTSSTK